MKEWIEQLRREDVQDYIAAHENDNPQKILLKQKEILGIPAAIVVSQLSGRQKAKAKLPLFYQTRGIIYPPTINLEQSSSQATALFKETLVAGHGADLTGGFGVDSFFMGTKTHIDYVEPDESLLSIAKHNHEALGAKTIDHFSSTAESYLQATEDKADFFFIDPSRRKDSKKVFKLAECTPNVLALLPTLLTRAGKLVVKTSPLLDLRKGTEELSSVAEVIVVSVENECKELLWILKKGANEPTIRSVDLHHQGEVLSDFSFTFSDEKNARSEFSLPLTYLYEPNAALLKAGAFKWTGQKFELRKLDPDSHLFTSENVVQEFPGRIFRVLEFVKLQEKLKEEFTNGYANILVRNFPMSVAEIKVKTGLKEGGSQYLICTHALKKKTMLRAERLK